MTSSVIVALLATHGPGRVALRLSRLIVVPLGATG